MEILRIVLTILACFWKYYSYCSLRAQYHASRCTDMEHSALYRAGCLGILSLKWCLITSLRAKRILNP